MGNGPTAYDWTDYCLEWAMDLQDWLAKKPHLPRGVTELEMQAVVMAVLLLVCFSNGKEVEASAGVIARHTGIPHRKAATRLRLLVEQGWLAESRMEGSTKCYTLERDRRG